MERTKLAAQATAVALLLAGCALTMAAQPAQGRECEANETAKLLASDGAPVDRFGGSVAISGDIAVIGAAHDDDNGADSGSAYVFRYDGSTWIEEQKLSPCDGAAGDFFGVYVAVSGETVVVAAHFDDDSGNRSGSAYVFRYDGAAWVEDAKLLVSDGAAEDQFGVRVAIDGDIAVIGAYKDDNENGADAGAAYVFHIPPGGWGRGPCSAPVYEDAKLLASDGVAGDHFGIGVSVSADTIVVGAFDNDTGAGTDSGSAYVFRFDGSAWVQAAILRPSDAAAYDWFGENLMINGDTAVIAAMRDDDKGSDSGSAYIFQKPPGGWVNMTETAKLTASDGAALDWFGYSVAISGDTAVVGADQNYNNGPGVAYVFKKPPGGWANMTETVKLTASDGAATDDFGVSVAISGDTAIIGAFEDDDNGSNSGSAYVFHGLSDCNTNGTLDICDIADGTSLDLDANGIPDECELPPLPPPPAQVTAEDSGAGGSVNVSWQANAPEDNVTGYRISFGQQSGSLDGEQLVDGNVTGYQVTGLANYVEYFFTVAAINNNGDGDPSGEVSATPTQPSGDYLKALKEVALAVKHLVRARDLGIDYTGCIELAVGEAQGGAQNFIAYQETQYGSGNQDIIKAWEAYNKGLDERSAGRLSKAVKRFRLSWAHAEQAE